MIVLGDYGTRFECDDFAGGNEPTTITTEYGSFEVPTTDLAMFYLGYCKFHDQKPVNIFGKADEYINKAVQLRVEKLLRESNRATSAEKYLHWLIFCGVMALTLIIHFVRR